MKITIGLFVIFLIISSSLSLPAINRNDENADLNIYNNSENSPQNVVNNNSKDTQGVVNESVGDQYNYFAVNPFRFLEYFQDNLRRLREGIEKKIWTQAELEDNEDGTLLDESIRNGTSVVETIDGHKIEINETVYANVNKGHPAFKVRVIQVRPVDLDDILETETTTAGRYTYFDEVVDDFSEEPTESEIDKTVIAPESVTLHNTPSEFTIDSTEDALAQQFLNESENDFIIKTISSQNYELLNETNWYTINETSIENEISPINLDSIILHNLDDSVEDSLPSYIIDNNTNILSEYSRESLKNESNDEDDDEDDDRKDNSNSEWETLEDYDNEVNNDIEMFSPVEVDLSNDTIINDILADQGAEQEFEAEIFSDFVINCNTNNIKTSKIVSDDDTHMPAKPNFSSTPIK